MQKPVFFLNFLTHKTPKTVHDHYSESDPDELDDDPEASEPLDELELSRPDLLFSPVPAAPEAAPPLPLAASPGFGPEFVPCGPRFCPASDRFFLGFFLKELPTNCSKALKVAGFRVSKSISISSGLESRNAGSRC